MLVMVTKRQLLAGLVSAASLLPLSGCKEDPPPPPPAPSAPPAVPTPPPMMTAPPLEPASPLGRRDGPKLKEATMKRYRADICYFGSLGVPHARESYWASLGPDAPSPLNIPSFGEYEEHQPRKPGGRVPLAAKMGRLPFEHHLRACTSAKALAQGKWKKLDEALEVFEAHTSVVARALGDAARYYAREAYRRDDFEKGRELHQKLSDELAGFEEAHRAFGAVYRAWVADLEPIAEVEDLDAGGKLSAKAVKAARALALAVLAGEPAERRAELTAEVDEHLTALSRRKGADPEKPHARLVTPTLTELLAVIEKVGEGPLDEHERYLVGAAFARVVDADQRSLSLQLGGGDPFGVAGRPRLPELAPMVGRKHKSLALPRARPSPSSSAKK